MLDLNDMKIALDEMRKGTLSPQIYKNRDEITAACRAGKVFACKCHRSIFFQAIFFIVGGIIILSITISLGIVFYAYFSSVSLQDAISLISIGVAMLIGGIIDWVIYRSRFLLVGPCGMISCHFHTRSFLPWDIVLNVGWKSLDSRKYPNLTITTASGLLDYGIVDGDYSSIDTFPSNGSHGLFDMIACYFQWSKTHEIWP